MLVWPECCDCLPWKAAGARCFPTRVLLHLCPSDALLGSPCRRQHTFFSRACMPASAVATAQHPTPSMSQVIHFVLLETRQSSWWDLAANSASGTVDQAWPSSHSLHGTSRTLADRFLFFSRAPPWALAATGHMERAEKAQDLHKAKQRRSHSQLCRAEARAYTQNKTARKKYYHNQARKPSLRRSFACKHLEAGRGRPT